MKILIAAIILTGTYFLIRLTGNLLKFLFNRHLKWKFLLTLIPFLELILGLSAVLWAINFLFQTKSYYNILMISIVVIFVGFVSWFLLRDIVAGYVFRIQNNFRPGAKIQLGTTIGKLLSMNVTHIIIETGDGRTIKIPYSRISGETVSEQHEEIIAEESSLILRLISSKSLNEIEDDIRKAIMNSPWRLLHREPIIKLKSQNGEYFEYEIRVKTRNKKHQQYLYNSLLKKFER